jgi:hypothetical protein
LVSCWACRRDPAAVKNARTGVAGDNGGESAG